LRSTASAFGGSCGGWGSRRWGRSRAPANPRLTEDAIRRGVFHSVAELKSATEAHLDQHNADVQPCIWTALAADIHEKVARGRLTLQSLR